jgi:hypothetical protein
MLSQRKSRAGIAVLIATLAAAVPAATSSAATTTEPVVDPTVCELMNPVGIGGFGPWIPGGESLANVLTHAGDSVGCPRPAAAPSLLPTGPGVPR